MARSIRSTTSTRELNKNLEELQREFRDYKNVVTKNTKELKKVNAQVEANKEAEMKQLQERLKKLELQTTQWVQDSEPALDIEPAHMLKKLDIL